MPSPLVTELLRVSATYELQSGVKIGYYFIGGPIISIANLLDQYKLRKFQFVFLQQYLQIHHFRTNCIVSNLRMPEAEHT